MFGRFSRQYWKKPKRILRREKKSVLGGNIKSMTEIDALSATIKAHEQKESYAADAMLDDAWGKLEKKSQK